MVLCLAIIIRYDKVFGNSDIQELLSRISFRDYYNYTINVFSIVNVTVSSVSIANVIFSTIVMVLQKWKRVLSFIVSTKYVHILWIGIQQFCKFVLNNLVNHCFSISAFGIWLASLRSNTKRKVVSRKLNITDKPCTKIWFLAYSF